MSEPVPYRSPLEVRPDEPADERHLPPWMRLKPGETEQQRTARVFHSCYICGTFIVDPKALDAHEGGHSRSEKAAAVNHRPA